MSLSDRVRVKIPPTGHAARRDLVARSIESAALKLIARQGFADVTVEQIAAECGISQRTFFRYFASKDDVLLNYYRSLHRRLMRAISERPVTEGPITAVRAAYRVTATVQIVRRAELLHHARMISSNPSLQVRARGEQVTSMAEIAALIAKRMPAGTPPHLPLIVTAALTGVAQTAWDSWVDDGVGDPADRIDDAIGTVVEGLAKLDEPRFGEDDRG